MPFSTLKFRSLESRITVTFLALILAIQLAAFGLIRNSIAENARAAIQQELEVGERIYLNLLDQNARNLTLGASVLASDYGFRQAIASADDETINSALENHAKRIGADWSVYYDAEWLRKAAYYFKPEAKDKNDLSLLIEDAVNNGSSQGISIINAEPHQVVIVPIRAPLTIGWVAMGFVINQDFVSKLSTLTSLQVSLMAKNSQGHWILSATSYNYAYLQQLNAQLPAAFEAMPQTASRVHAPGNSISAGILKGIKFQGFKTSAHNNMEMEIEGVDYSTRFIVTEDGAGHSLVTVLQRSISDAVAPYQRLQLTLLVLTLLGIILFSIGSIFTVRRITKPLSVLVDSAKRLGAGDYSAHIHINTHDEVGALGKAFEQMRNAISEREIHIRTLAYVDTLTGLPNRSAFLAKINEEGAITATEGTPFTVLALNLNRFKNVNDLLGTAVADDLLRSVAERLKSSCKSQSDFVARLGGDAFAILLRNVGAIGAINIANRITKGLEAPFMLAQQAVDMSAGLGIASFPEHTDNAEFLLSRAEMAMYAAKLSGQPLLVYDHAHDNSSQKNLSLMSDLRHAIDMDELVLYVQPKLDLASHKVAGAEALVRWMHPQRGLIYPDDFTPFAEKTGIIALITLWVLNKVAQYHAAWESNGLHVHLAINLSVRDLIDQRLPAKINDIFEANAVSPHCCSLEITESSIMDDPMRALGTIETLNDLGFSLSIDDFGTGYSSLAYLKRLPVQELKIDKSFVMNMRTQKDDAKIVRSTIELGHNLGLKVVAEGIEDDTTLAMLSNWGCDYGQGYFIGKPMPADEFPAWLAQWEQHEACPADPSLL